MQSNGIFSDHPHILLNTWVWSILLVIGPTADSRQFFLLESVVQRTNVLQVFCIDHTAILFLFFNSDLKQKTSTHLCSSMIFLLWTIFLGILDFCRMPVEDTFFWSVVSILLEHGYLAQLSDFQSLCLLSSCVFSFVMPLICKSFYFEYVNFLSLISLFSFFCSFFFCQKD